MQKAVALPPSKGPCLREPKHKASLKSKGKRARSPSSVEDESQPESDSSEQVAHTSKKSKGKQQPTKCARGSSPEAAVVKIEEMAMLDIKEVELSSHTGGDEHGGTDDEDVSTHLPIE